MNRRAFVAGLGAVLTVPLAAEAQQAAKVARIGWLSLNLAAAPHVPEASVKDCVTSATLKAATS